ncbi:MAG: ribbon-helix-helix domain-containing protein [Alphaproteobacteria bacterium]
MTGKVRKRSVLIAGHRTSVSLEAEFWDGLQRIARDRAVTVGRLIAEIDAGREGNLSSALRVFVLRNCHEAAITHSVPGHEGGEDGE